MTAIIFFSNNFVTLKNFIIFPSNQCLPFRSAFLMIHLNLVSQNLGRKKQKIKKQMCMIQLQNYIMAY